MTTTSADAAYDADKGGELDTAWSAAALSGLRRLHPVDGLFLRAEHLDQIQKYAGELSRLTAVAGGSGTVHGYELDLDVDKAGETLLHASPGLAVSEEGRPLRSLTTLEVDLGQLDTEVRERVWVVEVVPAESVLSGSEPAYSSVCATSCGPGSSIHPWQDDAVRLRVRGETLAGEWWGLDKRRRSAMASVWFERERSQAMPWLTPRTPYGPVDSLFGRPWSRPAPDQAPSASAVPLGLLFRDGDRWAIDVWAARRDRVASPPQAAWLPHLSMRNWSTYLAQVLQFQDQVARLGADVDLGEYLVELPPGGFIDVSRSDENNDYKMAAYFARADASGRQVRRISCTADVAISAVALAQHLDRIPLGDQVPAIDVWIPDLSADLPQLRTEAYPWVAFTRGVRAESEREWSPDDGRISLMALADMAASPAASPPPSPADVEDAHDDVAVHVEEAPRDRSRYAARIERIETRPAGKIQFAPDSWSLASRRSVSTLRRRVAGAERIDMVASAPDPEREPLMVARARSLAEELGLAEDGQTAVYAVHRDGPESIYVMVRP